MATGTLHDRNGEYEPQRIPNSQSRIPGFNKNWKAALNQLALLFDDRVS
ncbi:MAG: hypothetical protein GKR89_28560 [Candidatus Latescibacteria bacterium]|nr:hypothetical protein [Candidatus Latescibacterota bacterium]